METFTINAASRLLEKDRETLNRALRRIPPDETVGSRKQWRLPTIIDALNRNSEGGALSLHSKSSTKTLSDEEFMNQMFAVTEAWTRASDSIVALEEMPDETPENIRQAEGRKAFQKLEALRLAYEKAEPDGLSEVPRGILGQMFSGLLHACRLVITEDDGKTPLKSFYGEHSPVFKSPKKK